MIQKSNFKPAWWLSNTHLQTMWGTLFRREPDIELRRERFELPDGDFLDLDWLGSGQGPIVIMLHGLGGSIRSHYAKGMLQTIANQGWRGVFMHFRGCSGEPNRLPNRIYHSGDTTDINTVVAELKKREPKTPIAAIGFSVGGNVLLKWLGETGDNNPLAAAAAVSVPFELLNSANHINKGMSRVYEWWIMRDVRSSLQKKFKLIKPTVDIGDLDKVDNFWDLDDQITAPLHGFADGYDYYKKSSSRQFLKNIEIPTLILHAKDDPFMTKDVIAHAEELSPKLTLELSDCGGHVGFVAGNLPWKPIYWLEQRIPAYLKPFLEKE